MEILNLKKVKKSFDGNEILHGIDLSLEKGKVLSIIGQAVAERALFCAAYAALNRWIQAKS